MKNVIFNICGKLKGYSSDTEYFDVLKVEPIKDNDYLIVARLVNTEAENKEVASDESDQ